LRPPVFGPFLLLLFSALGCGGAANVTGTVTFDGKPIERGKIRFLPLDDKGELDPRASVVGSDIFKSKYTVKEVPFGKKQVAIDAQEIPGLPAADDQANSKRAPGLLIPPQVTRDLKVDINASAQTLDFPLKKPEAPGSGPPK
jgi:hypothetical protein